MKRIMVSLEDQEKKENKKEKVRERGGMNV